MEAAFFLGGLRWVLKLEQNDLPPLTELELGD